MLIDKYEGVRANWAPDIIGRAYGNRGDRHWLYTSICPGPFNVGKEIATSCTLLLRQGSIEAGSPYLTFTTLIACVRPC